jgi:hypothetical protein
MDTDFKFVIQPDIVSDRCSLFGVAFVGRRISMVGGSERTLAKIEMGVFGYHFPWGPLSVDFRPRNTAGFAGVDLPQDACYKSLVE